MGRDGGRVVGEHAAKPFAVARPSRRWCPSSRSFRISWHSLQHCCFYTTYRYNQVRGRQTVGQKGQALGSMRGIPSKNSDSVMSNPFAIFARFCKVTLRCPTSMEAR